MRNNMPCEKVTQKTGQPIKESPWLSNYSAMNFKVRRWLVSLVAAENDTIIVFTSLLPLGFISSLYHASITPLVVHTAYFFPCVIWDISLKLTTVDTLARHISRKIQWKSTHGCKSKWEFQVVKVIAKSRCVVRSDVMYAMGTHNLHFEGLWPISSLDRNTPMFYSLWVYLRPRWCLNQLHRKYMR